MSRQAGFTLIELLLSVTMIGMIAGLSLPVYVSFQTRNELATTTDTVVEVLRRAQNYARSGQKDDQWGVSIQSTAVTLFKGASYAARDTTYDETSAFPASVTASGLGETVFSKLAGTPSATGTVTLTSTTTDTDTMTINAKGVVSY